MSGCARDFARSASCPPLLMERRSRFLNPIYFTSEVHDASSRVVACRWSDSQPLGDIRSISSAHCAAICPDLVIGGSPCQDLSRAKRGGGDGIHGARSRLFFEYLRVLQGCQLVNPDLVFVLENVIPEKVAESRPHQGCLRVAQMTKSQKPNLAR